MQKLADSKQFLHDVWWLTKSYWQSEEKRKAYFLLGVIVALTLGVVYMLVLLNQWNINRGKKSLLGIIPFMS